MPREQFEQWSPENVFQYQARPENFPIVRETHLPWQKAVKPNAFNLDLSKNYHIREDALVPVTLPGFSGSVKGLVFSEEGITFPQAGMYAFFGSFGALKALCLAENATDLDDIIAICSFVARSSWHSAVDTNLCFDFTDTELGRRRSGFLPLKPLDKLFYSDQPLGLHCGHVVDCLAYILFSRNISCRRVVLKNTSKVGHIFLEVWVPSLDRWIYIDPDFGVMLKFRGQYIGADSVIELRRDSAVDDIEIIDIGTKSTPLPTRNFYASFSGQIAWSPAFMAGNPFASERYFRDVVIGKGSAGYLVYEYTARRGDNPTLVAYKKFEAN